MLDSDWLTTSAPVNWNVVNLLSFPAGDDVCPNETKPHGWKDLIECVMAPCPHWRKSWRQHPVWWKIWVLLEEEKQHKIASNNCKSKKVYMCATGTQRGQLRPDSTGVLRLLWGFYLEIQPPSPSYTSLCCWGASFLCLFSLCGRQQCPHFHRSWDWSHCGPSLCHAFATDIWTPLLLPNFQSHSRRTKGSRRPAVQKLPSITPDSHSLTWRQWGGGCRSNSAQEPVCSVLEEGKEWASETELVPPRELCVSTAPRERRPRLGTRGSRGASDCGRVGVTQQLLNKSAQDQTADDRQQDCNDL